MTGKELIAWIQENHAEELPVIVLADCNYLRKIHLWEGEADGGAIMIDAEAVE